MAINASGAAVPSEETHLRVSAMARPAPRWRAANTKAIRPTTARASFNARTGRDEAVHAGTQLVATSFIRAGRLFNRHANRVAVQALALLSFHSQPANRQGVPCFYVRGPGRIARQELGSR